jgi:hypothetical protein
MDWYLALAIFLFVAAGLATFFELRKKKGRGHFDPSPFLA